MRRLWAALVWLPVLACVFFGPRMFAAEVIPPRPDHYFNDYANVVPSQTAEQLNQQLADYERQTSSQILVVVYPKMQSDSSIEDYTVRIAQAWKAGQKGKDNGAVLFVFVQDHKIYLQVGYGLEGVLPDALAHEIIANEITPQFRAGNYTAGLTAGVHAILAAAKGEYKGSGRTVHDVQQQHQNTIAIILVFLVLGIGGLVLLLGMFGGLSGRRGYSSGGGWGVGSGGWWGGGWGGSGGWGGGGGGGWGGGGGGGFSAGGGSFGGGGAGGSW
ncbi:MAG TPA: TPM domain-containing protein [Verrucomicrobiae bacterium]|nr:TPM domain-containing protein [Verrucomicrobiae bacterium]